MKSTTPWENIELPQFPKLDRDVACDVLVIGGGITGLTAAYLLKKAGKRVVLLERDRLGSGDTGCTTAHLTHVTDTRLTELVSTFGRDAARLVWQGGNAAINTIEQIARTTNARCDFRRIPGFLHAPIDSNSNDVESLQEDCRLANELDFSATFLKKVPHVGMPGIVFPDQAKFHPLGYLQALATAVEGNGSLIFEQSEATDFSHTPRCVGTEQGKITCEYIVIATHVPLMGETGLISATMFQSKLAPYSTYAVGARLATGQFSEASYWDTADPYNYLRIDRGEQHDYAIFGGEDHKTGQAEHPQERFARLVARLAKIAPAACVDRRWSGQVIETHDGLPYIGETADAQFAATGFSGNGMTFGTLAAMMACDAVFGRHNPWKDIFSIERKTIRSVWDYIKENVDFPYYLVRDRIAPAPVASPDEIKAGEGAVLKLDGEQVACSRDEAGELRAVSAVCTHMGCLVRWNSAEQTWDCPCHGSRFRPTGEVLAGPAETPLDTAAVAVSSQGG